MSGVLAEPICREYITKMIQVYEKRFGVGFQRTDELWVNVSDTEEVCVRQDPTDVQPTTFPVAEVIELDEKDYTVCDCEAEAATR